MCLHGLLPRRCAATQCMPNFQASVQWYCMPSKDVSGVWQAHVSIDALLLIFRLLWC